MCACALLTAGDRLERAARNLEQLSEKTPALREVHRELALLRREWRLLYDKHVTEYRNDLQRALLQYAKVRALNAEAAEAPLNTGIASQAAVRGARESRKRPRAPKKK